MGAAPSVLSLLQMKKINGKNPLFFRSRRFFSSSAQFEKHSRLLVSKLLFYPIRR